MDQPVFHRDPVTGEVRELRPVVANRDELAGDLATAEAAKAQLDQMVRELESRRDAAAEQVVQLGAALEDTYKKQEEATEALTFRQARIAAYDAVSADGTPVVEAEQTEVVEDIEPIEPVAGQPTDEEVAASVSFEDDPVEPEAAESEEIAVPIRRRSAV